MKISSPIGKCIGRSSARAIHWRQDRVQSLICSLLNHLERSTLERTDTPLARRTLVLSISVPTRSFSYLSRFPCKHQGSHCAILRSCCYHTFALDTDGSNDSLAPSTVCVYACVFYDWPCARPRSNLKTRYRNWSVSLCAIGTRRGTTRATPTNKVYVIHVDASRSFIYLCFTRS